MNNNLNTYLNIYYPSAIKAVSQPLRLWGIDITRGGWAVRNSLTQKLTGFFFIFHRHDLCAWAIHPIYFFLAPSHKRPFSKMAA